MGALIDVPVGVYTLADVLGFTLYLQPDGSIKCKGTQTRVFGDLVFDVPVDVVSSCVTERQAAILVRTMGNLGLMFVTEYDEKSTVSLFVLDLSKMKAPEKLMEDNDITDPHKAPDLVDSAIVARYAKGSSKKWNRKHP